MSADRCELLCLDLPRAEALRAAAIDPELARRGADLAKSLADPTRLALALALRDGGELCVCDLAWIVERSENLVSHHLRLMRAAGLTENRRDGKMVLYSLNDGARGLLGALLENAVAAAT